MRKPDSHYIQEIHPQEKLAWSCSFGRCKRSADFIITRIYYKKRKNCNEHNESGACTLCALRWAKDCKTCLDRIHYVVSKSETLPSMSTEGEDNAGSSV